MSAFLGRIKATPRKPRRTIADALAVERHVLVTAPMVFVFVVSLNVLFIVLLVDYIPAPLLRRRI